MVCLPWFGDRVFVEYSSSRYYFITTFTVRGDDSDSSSLFGCSLVLFVWTKCLGRIVKQISTSDFFTAPFYFHAHAQQLLSLARYKNSCFSLYGKVCAPFSISCVYFETRFLFVSLLSSAHARSLFCVAWWGICCSGTPSRAREFGGGCTTFVTSSILRRFPL